MIRSLITALALLTLGACASTLDGPGAPAPAKPIDAERFYSGTWYEIGRVPMAITDGCVAGATTYTNYANGQVQVRDTCRVGSPTGREKAISGRGTIQDPGFDAKLRVRYWLVIVWDYWVLDRAEDYSWFISSDPTFTNLWIYTRDPEPSRALKDQIIRRASDLGYDVSRLEFPDEPAS